MNKEKKKVLPWQRKMRALGGEVDGTHLQANSSTSLEFLMHSCLVVKKKQEGCFVFSDIERLL